MNDEFLKLAFAVLAAVLYFLYKSQPKEKKNNAPEELNPPMPQVKILKDIKLKTVAFEDILKKFEQQAPTTTAINALPTQEVNFTSTAQLRKLMNEKEIKFDTENEDITLAERKKRLKEIETRLKELKEEKDLENKEKQTPEEKHKEETQKTKEQEANKHKNAQKELISRLKNPESSRHAFILSEIFNRKTW
jgi:hypothetical protein